MKPITCILGFHKWGKNENGIRTCQKCGKLDKYFGLTGMLRYHREKNDTKKETMSKTTEHEIVMLINEELGLNCMVPGGKDCRKFDFEQLKKGAGLICELRRENEEIKKDIEVLRKYIKTDI